MNKDARRDYEECVLRMVRAAVEHFMATGQQPMLFEDLEEKLSKEVRALGIEPGKDAGIIAPLANVIDEWALNDAARDFCRVMLKASDGRATYAQTRAVLHRLAAAYPVPPESGTMH